MKDLIYFLIFFFIVFTSIPDIFGQQEISIAKHIVIDEKQTISIDGDSEPKLQIQIFNPLTEDVIVRVTDNTFFGNSGIAIICDEHLALSANILTVDYPLPPISESGIFHASPTKLEYDDPEKLNKVEVFSNELDVEVIDPDPGNNSEVLLIYNCYGQNFKYTINSDEAPNVQNSNNLPNSMQPDTGSPIQPNFPQSGFQFNLPGYQGPSIQFTPPISQSPQSNQQNLAINQTQNEDQEQNMQDALTTLNNFYAANSKLQSLRNSLGTEVNPEILAEVESQRQEQNKILEILENDERFQEINGKLLEEGYFALDPTVNLFPDAKAEANIMYQNSIDSVNVQAQFENDQLIKIESDFLEIEEDEFSYYPFLLFLLLLIPLTYIIIKRRKSKTSKPKEIIIDNKTSQTTQIILNSDLLEKSKKLFDEEKPKDAVSLLSNLMRMYFSEQFSISRIMTNSELLNFLEDKKLDQYSLIENSFNICDNVEFAKGKISKHDFSKLHANVSKIIGS